MKSVRPSYRPSLCRLESRNQPGSTLSSGLSLGLLDSSLLFQNPLTMGLDQPTVQARPIDSVTHIQSSDAVDTGLVQAAQGATPVIQSQNLLTLSTPASDQLHQMLQPNLGSGIHTQGTSPLISLGGEIHTQGTVSLISRAYNMRGAGVAQEFTDSPTFSTHCYDPLTISDPNGWDISAASAVGVERAGGNITQNLAVVLAFSSQANDANLGDMGTTNGVENPDATMSFDFSDVGSIHLDAGSYWVSVYIVRPFNGGMGGQWYWGTADRDSSVGQSMFHNPGNGFGLGTAPFNGDRIYGTQYNQAFELDGNVT
jgi:hypothetical protein